MTDDIRERVSALLDGELVADEARSLFDRVEEREELQKAWGSYHLIGDIMRGEGRRHDSLGIADQVRQQISSEPAIIASPRRKGGRQARPASRWARPAVGAALAASVAVMTVYLLPQLPLGAGGGGEQLAATPSDAPYLEISGTRWKNLSEPKVESQLNRYLVDHNEFASSSSMSGVIPYASFVTYDSNSKR